MIGNYDAIRFVDVLPSGRTRPILLECEVADDRGISLGSFVVKAPGLPEVDDYGLFVETLGYLLAQELGLETPKPGLVRLSSEFVAAVNPVLDRFDLSVQSGVGFGSEHLGSGLVAASGYEHLDAEQLERAVNIFCYDLLTQNPDRLATNPNCLIKNGKFIAFDFNVAFSFLLLIGKVNEPWEFSKHQIAENHVFYRALRGKQIDFGPFINKVVELSPEKLDELLEAIPFGDGRWNTKVKDHLMSVVENAAKLEIEFARCLR